MTFQCVTASAYIPSKLALKRHICLSPGGEDEARTEDPIRCNETLEETK